MALDPEEYKQRRLQRKQEREARQARQKRLRIKLGIAGAVLAACAVLIFFVVRSGAGKNPEQQDPLQSEALQTTAPVEETPGSTPESTEPAGTTAAGKHTPTVIRLAAAGDLNINDAVVASGGTSYNYTETFMDIAHLLGEPDLTLLNFEGVLCGAPYGSSGSAPNTILEALHDAGVDLIQVANSYAIHKGMAGLSSTLAAIRAAGLEPVGAYESNEAFRAAKGYTIREVQGIKIAFMAFTKGMNGMALPAGSEKCVNVLYTDYATTYQNVDKDGILAVVEAAKKEKPDIMIALLHWGSEFNDTISTSQKSILELLQANGVGVILGTHSHYVQQMVFNPENGTFMTYSLGDFFSDAQRAGTEYSVILNLEITKDPDAGLTKVTDFSYTPIFTVAEKEKPLRIVRIEEAIAAYDNAFLGSVQEGTYSDMKYALTRIEERIAGE